MRGDVIVGRAAVLNHLRRYLDGAEVHEYSATDLRGRMSRSLSIVTYRWQQDRTVDRVRSVTNGHDMIASCAMRDDGQLGWRIQLQPTPGGKAAAHGQLLCDCLSGDDRTAHARRFCR